MESLQKVGDSKHMPLTIGDSKQGEGKQSQSAFFKDYDY